MAPRRPSKTRTSSPGAMPSPHDTDIDIVSEPPTPAPKIKKVMADRVEKAKTTKAKSEPKTKKEKPVKEKKEVKETVKKEVKVGKDGKEKVKAVTGDEAAELVKEYLRAQNRPYSATEVSSNLHGKVCCYFPNRLVATSICLCLHRQILTTFQVTKTVADKLLKEMAQNHIIEGKGTKGENQGSQWIFWTKQVLQFPDKMALRKSLRKQDESIAASPADLLAMDTLTTSTRESLPALKGRLKELSARLHAVKSLATSSELAAQVEKLQQAKKEKEAKLGLLKGGEMGQITKEESKKVEKEWAYWGKMRVGRKRLFGSVEGFLMDIGKKREDIWEEAGIEGEIEDMEG